MEKEKTADAGKESPGARLHRIYNSLDIYTAEFAKKRKEKGYNEEEIGKDIYGHAEHSRQCIKEFEKCIPEVASEDRNSPEYKTDDKEVTWFVKRMISNAATVNEMVYDLIRDSGGTPEENLTYLKCRASQDITLNSLIYILKERWPGKLRQLTNIIPDLMTDERYREKLAEEFYQVDKDTKDVTGNNVVNLAVGNVENDYDIDSDTKMIHPRHAIRAEMADYFIIKPKEKDTNDIRELWNEYLAYSSRTTEELTKLADSPECGCAVIKAYADIYDRGMRVKALAQDDICDRLDKIRNMYPDDQETVDKCVGRVIRDRVSGTGIIRMHHSVELSWMEPEQKAASIKGLKDALIENGYYEEAKRLEEYVIYMADQKTKEEYFKIDAADEPYFKNLTPLQKSLIKHADMELITAMLQKEDMVQEIESLEPGTGEYAEKLDTYVRERCIDRLEHALKDTRENFPERRMQLMEAAAIYEAIKAVAHRNCRDMMPEEKDALRKIEKAVWDVYKREDRDSIAADTFGPLTGTIYPEHKDKPEREKLFLYHCIGTVMDCSGMNPDMLKERSEEYNLSAKSSPDTDINKTDDIRSTAEFLVYEDCAMECRNPGTSMNGSGMYSREFLVSLGFIIDEKRKTGYKDIKEYSDRIIKKAMIYRTEMAEYRGSGKEKMEKAAETR